MNATKSKGAWAALLAAGGMYAWQNRDKIVGWLNTQRDQLASQTAGSANTSLPVTGETRRISESDLPSSQSTGSFGDTTNDLR